MADRAAELARLIADHTDPERDLYWRLLTLADKWDRDDADPQEAVYRRACGRCDSCIEDMPEYCLTPRRGC